MSGVLDRLLRSPVADLVFRPWFDRLAIPAIAGMYCPLSRAWAAALVADGVPERFRDALGSDAKPGPLTKRVTRRAISRVGRKLSAYEAAAARWEADFFGPEPPSPQRLIASEAARHGAAHALMASRLGFVPLKLAAGIGPVKWAVAPPPQVERRHGRRLGAPELAFAPPDPPPAIERSRPMAVGGGEQFWLRFPTPAPGVGGTAWARVNAPKGEAGSPSLIFTHGIAMEPEFWRHLADPIGVLGGAGLRLIRPEGPWHGRRMHPGSYGGEPVLARGPLGFIDYLHAHVIELGLLTAWARQTGSGPVAIGGLSLGALTAQLAAVAARDWPAAMRPDAVLLLTTSGAVTEVTFDSRLMDGLGLPAALAAEGWDRNAVSRWAPLVEPVAKPALGGERIVVLLGTVDNVTPFAGGEDLVRKWAVPEDNLFLRPQGHFSASLGLARDPAPLDRFVTLLKQL
ncbi:MAG: alpha/beta hydrolase family protein [Proteobacteria bacterium]|nr:alpha/beta hydrolase family protein [Pseudomonadota bacterium]